MMKTSVGICFRGFISIDGNAPKPMSARGLHQDSARTAADRHDTYVRIDISTRPGEQLYTSLPADPGGGTRCARPLRAPAGFLRANLIKADEGPAGDDRCSRPADELLLLTTDGFWNGTGQDIVGTALGNWNREPSATPGDTLLYNPPVSARLHRPVVSGRPEPSTETFCRAPSPGPIPARHARRTVPCNDYMTDLRGGVDKNNKTTGPRPAHHAANRDVSVTQRSRQGGTRTSATPAHGHLHLGLATVDALRPNYEALGATGFPNIKAAWQRLFLAQGVCTGRRRNRQADRVDDLWHAASRRGTFFQPRIRERSRTRSEH